MAFLQEYTMLDEIGRGGFATVYKVRHNELGYIRAVRVLNETIVDERSVTYQKFMRECRVLLRLGNGNHPNIVHIYQPRLLDNKALVEMDYVDGMDLTHYLKQNQNFVPVEEVIRMAEQISSALAYCHEDIYRFCMDRDTDHLQDDPNDGSKVLVDVATRKNLIDKYKVIHNDIHSGNIMRREDVSFVLLDFGLAINGNEVVRSSRHVNGAPEYKAPEKWDDDSILTEQSDIYSFGIVLYHYLAGRVPFPYNTRVSNHIAEYELAEAHQKAVPPSIETIRKEFFEKKYEGQVYKKDYPQWLEDMILKCLRKKPEDRFKNGKELYDFIMEHALETVKVTEEVEQKLENLKTKNEALETEVASLREINRSLNSVVNEKQTAPTTHAAATENPPAHLQPRSHKRKVWPWVLAVCAVVGIAVSILLLGREKKNDVGNNNTEEIEVEVPAVERVETPVENDAKPAMEESKPVPAGYVDLGLSVYWKNSNEWNSADDHGFYTYDDAKSRFGSRLPTKAQLEELKNKCKWTWSESKEGYYVKGPNGNSIFLPAAGYRGCNGSVYNVGSYGYYWSSTPDDSDHAWRLYFYSGEVYLNINYLRCLGQSVRLVQD